MSIVCVTTSGTGSRLFEYTKYTNKSLVKVGDKYVINYIIDSYPNDTIFVVTLGYYGNLVKDFLELCLYLKSQYQQEAVAFKINGVLYFC